MAGKQMSVFIGRFYQAKSAFHGIKRLLRESDTANAQTLAAMTDEIYPRLLAMIGHFEAIPIATAYDYDPKLGAHLSYLLIGSAAWNWVVVGGQTMIIGYM